MPTYEYECAKCKKRFDAFQSMKDDPYKTCPKDLCRMKSWGKGKVKRLLGAGAGLIFKGSGFYITDYRSEGYKSAAKNDSKSDSASSSPKPADGATASASSETKKSPPTDSSKTKKTPPKKS
jgi:putative FmdB family regulatory protein